MVCTKNFSKTHSLFLLLFNWASLISYGVNSTPTISSPCIACFPNLFFIPELNLDFIFSIKELIFLLPFSPSSFFGVASELFSFFLKYFVRNFSYLTSIGILNLFVYINQLRLE